MKRIAAVAIILLSSSTLFAAQKQQQSSWTSGIHHLKMTISSTATKSVNGIKSVMHLDSKKSK
jgi:hypothetical protein